MLEPFTLRIRKVHNLRPDLAWYNTYEFRNQTATNLADLITACNNIVSFERQLHRTSTQYVSYTLSTWEQDGQPYNPDTFVTQPLAVSGTISALDQAMPLHICWRVAWVPQTGRNGFRLYRNCLSESDVDSGAGFPTLANVVGMEGRLQDAVDGGPIGDYFSAGSDLIQFMMESASNAREINAVTSAGVTVKKLNNRYFDRVP